MTRKNYSPEFKAKVVIEVLKEEEELNAIASKYDLNPNMLRTWRKDFLEHAATVFETPSKSEKIAKRKEEALEKKNTQMLKTIGKLTVERDFLQECFRTCGLPIPELDPKEG